MKIILKHLTRNILEKKLRTAIILFTILFSTMVLFTSLSLNTIITDTYQKLLKGSYGNADLIISKDSEETHPFYETAAIDTDGTTFESRTDIFQATGKSILDGEREKVQLTGADYDEAEEMKLVKTIQSVQDFDLAEKEVVISQKSASEFELELEDEINVSIDDSRHSLKVAAIGENNGIFSTEMDNLQMIVPQKLLQDTLHQEDSFTSTFLRVPDDKLEKTESALSDANSNFSIETPGSLESEARDEEAFQAMMIAAIAIIILISSYVIISLAKVIVAERMPVIGTFRSIGTTKRMMHSILALEFLLYGLIGATFGGIASYFLLPFVADIFNEYKAYGVETDVTYNPVFFIIAYSFGVLFPVLISLYHILKAGSKTLKDTILNTAQTKKELSKTAVITGCVAVGVSFILFFINKADDQLPAALSFFLLLIGTLLLMPLFLNILSLVFRQALKHTGSGELKLAVKNIGNNKVVANNSSMIIVVFLLMLMIGITGKGLDDYVSDTTDTGYDILISDLEEDPSDYKDISNTGDVTDTNVQYVDNAPYKITDKTGEFTMNAVEDINAFATFYDGVTFKADAKEAFSRNNDGVIIDRYQQKRYGLEKGDPIQVKATSEVDESEYFDVIVSGVMDSSTLNSNKTSVLVHQDIYKEYFTTDQPKIALKVADGSEADSVKSDLANDYFDTDLTIQTFDEMIAGQKDTIDTLINGIVIVVLLGLLIGLLGITNNFIVSFMQRKQSFAVLYSVSMSRSQLVKMLFQEMLMTFLALLIIGFIGGYAMYLVTVKLLISLGLVVPMAFHFGWFGLLSAAAFILLALSTLSTVRRLKRLNILTQLRYE